MLGLIGSGMFLDGFEIYLAGGVLGVLVKEGWSNLQSNAHFISATFVGMVIGAWLAGVLGDRYGRRFSYQFNLLIFGLASLAGAAAPSMGVLIVARFFMGLGLGAEIVVGYVTLIEFVPSRNRGRWLAGLAIITNSALFISSLAGYIVIPWFGWRAMFVLGGIGALAVWQMRKSMPESPRWLESKGRLAEAEQILQTIELEASRAGILPVFMAEAMPRADTRDGSLGRVFSRELLPRTVVGCVICLAVSVGVYGLIVWIPTFFVRQGYTVASSLGFTTLMSLGGPVGAAIGLLTADRLGRRPTIIGTSLVAAVLSVAYPYAGSEAVLVGIGFILVTSIYLLISVGWALYVPELFPTTLRMRGAGLCNTVGRAATIAIPYIVVSLFTAFALPGLLALVIGIMLLVCVLTFFLGPETRERSLEVMSEAAVAAE